MPVSWPRQHGPEKYCESFVQATQARLLLEPAIARQAAQTATPEELEQLRKNVHTALPVDHSTMCWWKWRITRW